MLTLAAITAGRARACRIGLGLSGLRHLYWNMPKASEQGNVNLSHATKTCLGQTHCRRRPREFIQNRGVLKWDTIPKVQVNDLAHPAQKPQEHYNRKQLHVVQCIHPATRYHQVGVASCCQLAASAMPCSWITRGAKKWPTAFVTATSAAGSLYKYI